jgi:hypothetical protein
MRRDTTKDVKLLSRKLAISQDQEQLRRWYDFHIGATFATTQCGLQHGRQEVAYMILAFSNGMTLDKIIQLDDLVDETQAKVIFLTSTRAI